MDVLDADAFVRAHHAAVVHHARAVARHWRGHVEVDDLVGVGLMAVIGAAATYDESKNVPFPVHAGRSARWAMLSEARSSAPLRRTAANRRRSLLAAEEREWQRSQQSPTVDQLAGELGLTPDAVAQWQREARASERAFLDDADDALASNEGSPEEAVVEQELLACLHAAIAALPDRLRTVVEATFFEDRGLLEVAREMGVTESRVSQLRTEATTLLRHGLQVLVDGDPLAGWEEDVRVAPRLAAYRRMLGLMDHPAGRPRARVRAS